MDMTAPDYRRESLTEFFENWEILQVKSAFESLVTKVHALKDDVLRL